MSTNLLGRGRSVGIGQQELELPKRNASTGEPNVVFQRGTPNLTCMRREVFSTPSKIQAA